MQRPRQTDQSIVVNSARRVITVFFFIYFALEQLMPRCKMSKCQQIYCLRIFLPLSPLLRSPSLSLSPPFRLGLCRYTLWMMPNAVSCAFVRTLSCSRVMPFVFHLRLVERRSPSTVMRRQHFRHSEVVAYAIRAILYVCDRSQANIYCRVRFTKFERNSSRRQSH